MSPFSTFVSRRMAAAIAVFAVVAAAFVGFAAAGGSGTASGTPDITAQVVDPQAFRAALDDPGSIDTTAADDQGDDWKQLRADLRAARALEGDARRDALADIRQKALDGAYGDGIERRADRRQVHRELFFSLLPDNLQADLTDLKNAPADQREQLRREITDNALAGDYGPEVQKAAEQLQELRKS